MQRIPRNRLRIGIHAWLGEAGDAGGVEQILIGLIHALGRLTDGDEEYVILVAPNGTPWLNPYVGRNQLIRPYPHTSTALRRRLGRMTPRWVHSTWQALKERAYSMKGVPPHAGHFRQGPLESNGFLESLDLSVVHFPFQSFIRTRLPTIFTPWDLQHLHLPQLFTPAEVAEREGYFSVACRSATVCVAASNWIKQDLISKYALVPEKIQIIPIAPPTESYPSPTPAEVEEVRRKFALPSEFAFYPAQTWPHKNHILLLQALAWLRDEKQLRVNLVCTGKMNDHWPRIAQTIDELRLGQQVRFLGFVTPKTLRSIYSASSFVVLPTLFEGGCLPMLEAFREGVPVACSTVTHLPELAGGAAHLFDATSVCSIAEAVERLARDRAYCDELRIKATQRVHHFTWERSARIIRALYRKTAGRMLSADDEELLRESC